MRKRIGNLSRMFGGLLFERNEAANTLMARHGAVIKELFDLGMWLS